MADRVMLTGGTGFLGSAIARALVAGGYEVRALARLGTPRDVLDGVPVEFCPGDLTDAASLAAAMRGCAAVIHCAADYRIWVPDPARMDAVNVAGTEAVMRAALAEGCGRIVHVSSVATLKPRPDGRPATEADAARPDQAIGPYKRSKTEAERLVERLVAETRLPAVIVNPSTPIGPRDRRPTPTGRIIQEAARGRMPAYVDTGLNLVHVEDVAAGCVAALTRGTVGERHILGGEDVPLGDMLARIAAIFGHRRPVRLPRWPLWPLALGAEAAARVTRREPMLTLDGLRMAGHRMYFSSAKAEAVLGYRARPWQEGVADAVAWFREQGMLAAVTASLVGLAACLAWGVLLLGRGFFWRAEDDDRGAAALPDPAAWPSIAAIVPARDEAATIGATVASLLAQDYPGEFRLVVVDDRSTDGTGDLARAAAGGDPRLLVVRGGARAAGWTGKLWALEQGLRAVPDAPDCLLFTDADIRHAPDSLRMLVRRATAVRSPASAAGGRESAGQVPVRSPAGAAGGCESAGQTSTERRVLVSLMARLRCESPAERWLIPAFIFFFQMLYPFRWSNDPAARTAAAAGGCVLLDRAAFERAGGLAPIRGALIDDCALARRMKAVGPIWTGLTDRVDSLRPYEDVGPIRRMVARTAYAQLGYRAAALAGMIAALALVFLAPPLLALFAGGPAAWLGALAWGAMTVAFAPTLRRFGLSPLRGLALPGIAAAYMAFTLDSALAEWRGRGGMWKGEAGPRMESGADPGLH